MNYGKTKSNSAESTRACPARYLGFFSIKPSWSDDIPNRI